MGEYNDMKKWLYFPVIGIAIGDFLLFSGNILAGIEIHLINLLAIILMIIFGNLSLKIKNILQSMILLPLLRIISLSIPQLSKNIYMQHLIIYGIMFVPIYLIMKNQHILHKESETNLAVLIYETPSFGKVYIYIPIVILTMVVPIAMFGKYIGIIPSIQTIPEVGKFVSIFLIIILSISILISETKYWNEYLSNSLDIYSSPLLLTYVIIVIQKIMVIMKILKI